MGKKVNTTITKRINGGKPEITVKSTSNGKVIGTHTIRFK